MTLPSLTEDEVVALARELLGIEPLGLARVPVGFGNESWRIASVEGAFVLKVGPGESAAKWASARVAQSIAGRVGVPAPKPVHLSVRQGRVVRAYEWVDGVTAAELRDRPVEQARLGADLGAAVAALHAVPRVSYSSRLDGSAPTFARWDEYVSHRLSQIEGRAQATDTVDARTLAQAVRLATSIAGVVSDAAHMTLCHRDLHADNLVVGEDGDLRAILDWDMAETWDQAGEWFKLDGLLFRSLPACREAFDAAYDAAHPDRRDWALRNRLVDLLESLNSAVTAPSMGWASFGQDARARLDRLLTES